MGENFFNTDPPQIVECISEYIFLISKNKQAETKKGKTKKAKETKEENKISLANRLKKNFVAVRVKIFFVTFTSRNKSIFLCTFSTDDHIVSLKN